MRRAVHYSRVISREDLRVKHIVVAAEIRLERASPARQQLHHFACDRHARLGLNGIPRQNTSTGSAPRPPRPVRPLRSCVDLRPKAPAEALSIDGLHRRRRPMRWLCAREARFDPSRTQAQKTTRHGAFVDFTQTVAQLPVYRRCVREAGLTRTAARSSGRLAPRAPPAQNQR